MEAERIAALADQVMDETDGLDVIEKIEAGIRKALSLNEGWIPVSERLPEDGESAIVFIPQWEDAYLRMRVAWIDYDDDCEDIPPPRWIHYGEITEGVTHWKPLPAPPSQENK